MKKLALFFVILLLVGLASAEIYTPHPQAVYLLPGAPNPTAPAYQATGVSIFPIFTWNTPTDGGTPTGYHVYLGTDTNPTNLLGSTAGNIFMLNSPLQYDSVYFWKVTAFNADGEGPSAPAYSFTTMSDPTVNTFPWLVDFGTLTSDWPVPNWTQLTGVFPNPTAANSQWSRDDWVNIPASGNNAARMNVFGTQRYGWLISPPIDIPADGYELQFSLGLTDYTNPSPIEDPTSQLDDKFLVAVSNSRNMESAMVLREWNNAGSQYVYNQIPHTGLVSSIPLTGITGTKYFAFYGESTLVGGDNDLYVDNITVRLIQTGGQLAVSPSEWDFGTVYIDDSAEKTFLVTNNGYDTVIVSSAIVSGDYFELAEPFLPDTLAVGESFSLTVDYEPTAAGEHAGTLSFGYDTGSTSVNLSALCHDPVISDLPWCEDFGTVAADWPVIDWAQFHGAFPTPVEPYDFWDQDIWLNQPGGNNRAARIQVNIGNYNAWLLSPGINLDSDDYQLSFDLGLTLYNSSDPIVAPNVGGNERLIVVLSANPLMAEPVVLREWNNSGSAFRFNDIPHTGTNVSIPLPDISGIRYFAFYLECTGGGGNFDDLMLDNVSVSLSTANSDPELPALTETGLRGNFPNPFNPETTIRYFVKTAAPIALDIYNLKGQLVKSLVRADKVAGEHSVVWNGTDESGNPVASGIYFTRLSSGGVILARKMILAK